MLPIENSFIFPGLDKYSVFAVLEQADDRSIVVVSGVNREACQFLSNEGYFKPIFARRHPHLMAFGVSFPVLCESAPTNCWTLLSYASQEGGLAVSNALLKPGIPFLCGDLGKKKAHADEQIQWACGSGYEDPKSLIHRLWLDYKKAESDLLTMMDALQSDEQWLRANRNLSLAHEGAELNTVMEFLKSYSWLLMPGHEESLFEVADSRLVPLRQDLLPCYRDWHFFYRRELKADDWKSRCYKNYKMIETYRCGYCEAKEFADREIALLQDPLKWMESRSMQGHQLKIKNEFQIAMAIEKQLNVVASCIHLIDEIEEGRLKPTPEVCNQILTLICSSFSVTLETHVWSKLFQIKEMLVLNRELFTERFNASFPQCLGELRSILSSIPKELVQATAN